MSLAPDAVPEGREDFHTPHAGVCHVGSRDKAVMAKAVALLVLLGLKEYSMKNEFIKEVKSYLPRDRHALLPSVGIAPLKSICQDMIP